ncbi:MAG: cob(I)yrinic acid a,c-diamide adenosyltransferase, partial [Selenomonas sp.]|nr:cob(I)yrinic acid a,c-diamide adenosyltransferase [Selenomonas sp.]
EIKNGKWDLIILDEINYAVKYELITEQDMQELLDLRPAELHLVLTGRDACDSLIERADLVTEM